MKSIFLFTGLLSLLFFNNGGNVVRYNYHGCSKTDNLCFESAAFKDIWNFEKTESNQFELSDRKNQNKKRSTEPNLRPSEIPGKITTTITGFKSVQVSKTNLFLIFHFSQSLWQVFLQ